MQTKPDGLTIAGHDYEGKTLHVGGEIRSIETGWRGQIVDIEQDGMLRCLCSSSGVIEEDDERWFAPADTLRVTAHDSGHFTKERVLKRD